MKRTSRHSSQAYVRNATESVWGGQGAQVSGSCLLAAPWQLTQWVPGGQWDPERGIWSPGAWPSTERALV